ncbi:MAG: T9SS type A sorting domain-containing protein [Candidatus Tenebribacter mawsonii]|nr:T9SS type A sorting domain-containing protein [Candidatus Tenebribacter mawsonii]
MKKYYLLALILVLSISIAMATELHVGPGQQYSTIQNAVDVANPYDVIILHPFTYVENVNLDNFQEGYLTIRSTDPQDPNIVETTVVNPANQNTPTFLRTTSPEDSYTSITISGLTISDGGTAIRIYDIFWPTYFFINYCVIENNFYGIMSESFYPINVDYSILRDNSYIAIRSTHNWAANRECIIISNSLVSSNGSGLGTDLDMIVEKCTIVNNTNTGISNGYGTSTIKSSIIYGNNTQINNGQGTVNVTYSDIQGGFDGLGNINANPLFEDPSNGNYHLTDASPCVDTGDPTYPPDPDGTTIEMGCYYFPHPDYDIHHLSKGYNWESFSRIGTEPNGNVPTNIVPILVDIDPFEDITDIFFDAYGPNDLTYNGTSWTPDSYLAQSSWLYKIKISPEEERLLTVNGERLPADFTLEDEDPLEAGTKHWLGFWLPRNQKMIESFGVYWENVAKVYSEHWYYSPAINPRGGDPTYPCAISAEGLILESGKGYMVLFKDLEEPITDFHWTLSDAAEEPKKKAESESFNYTEKADYDAIDVFNIPPNVTEIGVFEDDVCVGAVVVEDTCAQILVYSDYANRDPIPFTFEVVTGRGFSTPVKDYQVLNLQTGEYETKSIFSGRQDYSILRFGNDDEPENNTLSTPKLHGNYPNPFNPTTTISFSLPDEQEIDLTIYNIKGQKVKRLINGQLTAGQHSMIWDGKDTNEKSVSTGIYFYKLKTGNDVLTRKMLMLK